MPSDARVAQVVEALAERTGTFRSVLAKTIEQIRALLTVQHTGTNGHVARLGAELGSFADSRIDPNRFSSLFTPADTLNAVNVQRIERAYQTLSALMEQGDELFVVNVQDGRSLRDGVATALAQLGTAFGAARAVELTRAGRYRLADHAILFSMFPFEQWSAAERALAPPMVVHVQGADLHTAGLAEFLDGSQKVILVVRGDAPPAPLARLITPGTFVLQTADGGGLDRFAAWDGPGVAALLPESAARFLHDPAGATIAERLTVEHVPDGQPRKALGGISAGQQAEDLRQLAALSQVATGAPATTAPAASAQASGAEPAADPAGKLAAWLLDQADLTNVG
jgi:hypothetical protein